MRAGTVIAISLLLVLGGCGGDDGPSPQSSAPPAASAPPPAPAPVPPPSPPPTPQPPPVIGSDGGVINESSGATVTFPAGAVTDDTTFRIAVDSTGAPPIPEGLTAAGSMYVITPHGGDFRQPVEVSIPAPRVTLLPTQKLVLAKAQPGGQWELLDTELADGKLKAEVNGFSIFSTFIVNYPLPIFQAEPFAVTMELSCGEQDCARLFGPASITVTVRGNGGQPPEICTHLGAQLTLAQRGQLLQIPMSGHTMTLTTSPAGRGYIDFHAYLYCGPQTVGSWRRSVYWNRGPSFPNLSIMQVPAQLDVVEGLQANLDVVILGGAMGTRQAASVFEMTGPTATDRAIVQWQRSDDGGSSWRTIAHSYQHEANPLPFGTGLRWMPWGVRHGFIATAMDQGALIRTHACYTPRAPTAAPPCVTGAATRINVLQQSALPAIVEQPRSVLIRNSETANFSVTASGQPAPTLQWQTRPANSTGEWVDVTVGAGATNANYTTAPRALADNGEQYRVIATNALGSVTSSPVTLSVSDRDVAPSITTQPASLSVTAGGDAVFAIDAYGTEALSYQWRFNGSVIAGENSPVLRLTGVTNASAGSYAVTVANNSGSVTSSAAVLSVTAGTPAVVAPSIVTQPASLSVNVGNTATFAVGVDGSGPFSFQWRRGGVDISGATSASMTFSSVATTLAGSYSVVVSNGAGSVTSSAATLDVLPAVAVLPPSITSQPSTVIVPEGGSATLAVGATGSGPLSYQWSFNSEPIAGATRAVLNVTNVSGTDVGSYGVTVSNSLGAVSSEPAQIILLGAPVIEQQPAAVSAIDGGTATFSVVATGSGLRYQWLLNDSAIGGATGSSYTTPMLVPANSGAIYSVMVYNGAGLVISQGAVLTVQTVIAPSVAQQPVNLTVQPGQSAAPCVAFNGSLAMEAQLQRWNGASWLSVSNLLLTSNERNCFSTPPLQASDNGAQFRFVASNAAGQAISNAITVTVATPALAGTVLVSASLAGGLPDHLAGKPSISANGRLVAFVSSASNLAAGVSNPSRRAHAYVRNIATGVTTLIDQTPAGTESPYHTDVSNLKLAAAGGSAVFTSRTDELVAGDTNGGPDLFLRDLEMGTTKLMGLLPDGSQVPEFGEWDSYPELSADGRWVLFRSYWDLTGDGSQLPAMALFVRDTVMDTTRRIAMHTGTYQISHSAISADGQFVFYILPSTTNHVVHVVDVATGADSAVFTLQGSPQTEFIASDLSVSDNGDRIAFSMNSPALGLTSRQAVIVDRSTPDSFTIVSTGENGVGNGSSDSPVVSGDGRYVIFTSTALNLIPAAHSLYPYLLMRDLVANTTTVVSRRADGSAVAVDSLVEHALSRDGSVLTFVAEGQVWAAPRP